MHSRRWSRVFLRIVAALAAAGAVLLCVSLLRVPGVQPAVVAATLAFSAIAVGKPVVALGTLAMLTPVLALFSSAIGLPVAGTEPLIIAAVGGWSVRVALGWDEYLPVSGMRTPWLLLVFLGVASAVVETAVEAIYVVRSSAPVLHFLRSEYFSDRSAYPPIHAAMLLLEGLLLFAWTSNAARTERSWKAVATLLALSGVPAALLNLSKFVQILARSGLSPGDPANWMATPRVNVLHGDVNAAASYFVLVAALECGLALYGGWRTVWWIAAALVTAALWLTGSRTALAIAAVMGLTVLAWVALRRGRTPSVRALAIASALSLVGGITAGYHWHPEKFAGIPALEALRVRRDMAVASIRMTATYPLFGIGMGRFYSRSPEFMPVAVAAEYSRENAHNNFLQILAELGFTGLVPFAWLLAAVLVTRAVDADTFGHHETLPLRLGLVGFLFTCLMGHPLLVREVAYPFWIAVGLAGARLPRLDRSAWRATQPRVFGVVGAVVVILLSIPVRVVQHSRDVNLEEVASGVSAWERDAAGTWVRHLTGSSTFYAIDAPLVEIPLRLTNANTPVSVLVVLEGKPANVITLQDTDWRAVRVILPAERPHARFRRFDVSIDPGSAAVVMGRLRYP